MVDMRQLTRHTVPVLALAVAACGGDKGPAFTKRFDQLDLAQWEKACGPRAPDERLGSDTDTDVVSKVSFASERVPPGPHMPPRVFCAVYHRNGGRITALGFNVSASTEAELMNTRAPVLELTRSLVPDSVRSGLLRLAEAPERTGDRIGGFDVQAGFWSTSTGRKAAWDLDITTAR